MAITLVETITASSTITSIQFLNIPQTGKELLVVFMGRSSGTLNSGVASSSFRPNNLAYESYNIQGNGSSGSEFYQSNNINGLVPDGTRTANTFSSAMLRVLDYTNNQPKRAFMQMVTEDNSSTAFQRATWGLTSNTSAVTSLVIAAQTSSGDNFIAGSTASLYLIS